MDENVKLGFDDEQWRLICLAAKAYIEARTGAIKDLIESSKDITKLPSNDIGILSNEIASLSDVISVINRNVDILPF